MHNTHWSEEEEQIIRDNYFEKGSFATQDLLTEKGHKRSIVALRTRAAKLGIKTRPTFRDDIVFKGDKPRRNKVPNDGGGTVKQGNLSLDGRHHDDRRPILPPKEFQKKTELYLGLPMFTWPSTSQGVGEIMRVVNKVLSSGVQGTELCEDAKKFLGSVAICMNKLGERIAEQCK